VPGPGKMPQAFVAASCLEDSLHVQMMTILPFSRNTLTPRNRVYALTARVARKAGCRKRPTAKASPQRECARTSHHRTCAIAEA
jgi:hypothetical protein